MMRISISQERWREGDESLRGSLLVISELVACLLLWLLVELASSALYAF